MQRVTTEIGNELLYEGTVILLAMSSCHESLHNDYHVNKCKELAITVLLK